MQGIFHGSRKLQLLSDVYCPSLASFEPPTSQLHLPEVWTPAAQYLIDAGLRPVLAQRLSNAYTDFVARYRGHFESYFKRAISKGCHLSTEYYRDAFIVQFKRTIQVWDSQFVSIIQVWLRQAGAPSVSFRPEHVDIRVDDAAKTEIIARLGIKATHLTPDRVANPIAHVTSRLEEVSDAIIDSADSRLVLLGSPPIAPISRHCDPFRQAAPQTCFPAPYPPPPASYPNKPLATLFVPSIPPRVVRSPASCSYDVSSLTNLFGRMTITKPETNSGSPKGQGGVQVPHSEGIKPSSLPPSNNCTKPQLVSATSAVSPTKPTNASRRRKIASLPTRRDKTSASPLLSVFDCAGATSRAIIPCPTTERVIKETADYGFASQTYHTSTHPSPYTVEAPFFAKPKSSTPRQRKVHTLRKTLPQTQPIPQHQTFKPRATAGKTFYNVSRSPPLVSDATSYFDSPPTSSDELDTPPSTPPSSHVLLASTSTESLGISSESDRIVSRKDPLGDAKLPYSRQRYRPLDFTKGGLGGDEKPLTFTFSI